MSYKNFLVCCLLVFTLIFSIGCDTTANTNNTNNTTGFDNSIITNTTEIEITPETTIGEMARNYRDASVTVIIYETETDTATSMGSGIAVYSGGYIATNWHVISYVALYPTEYYAKIEIMQNGEMEQYNADLLWSSDMFDLAIIRSEFYDIPFVSMADRWIDSDNKLEYFEDVWTIGTPYDMSLYGTSSKGYISCDLERVSSSDGRIYESMIQHTSPISNGSSGSGLFDMDGNLIALNTLGVASTTTTSANDLYFSTPIYPIINIIEEIATLEEDQDPDTNYSFPKIGVSGYDRYMNEEFTESGLYSRSIITGGACDGLLNAGDIITGISTTTATPASESGYYEVDKRNDLLYALSNFNKGDSVKLYIKYSGELNREVTIVLG